MAKKIFNFGERLALYEDLPANTQYNTMPEPNIENINNIIQYTGDTNQNYTNGYFYKCVSDGEQEPTYSWEPCDTQEVDLSGYQTKITSDNKLNSDLVDDTNNTNKFVNANDMLNWNEKAIVGLINGNSASNYIIFDTLKKGFYELSSISETVYYKIHSTDTLSTFGYSTNKSYDYLIIEKTIEEAEHFFIDHPLSTNCGFGYITGFTTTGQVLRTNLALKRDGTLYVTGSVVGNYYLLETAQTIKGVKTFNSIPKINSYEAPTVDTELTAKKYVDDAIAAAVAEIDITSREIVQQLPTQDISTKTIYMVPSSTPGTQNVYDEYMYINNAWELIGSTAIDLSNYYTKTEVDSMIQALATQIGNITEVLSHLVDTVEPINTTLYTKNITVDGNSGTYEVIAKEHHIDTDYYVLDYNFTNTSSNTIRGLILDEIYDDGVNPAKHVPLLWPYDIEPGETVALTSYWQDPTTYQASLAKYNDTQNITVESGEASDASTFTQDLPLANLGFTTDVVAHTTAYNSNDVTGGFTRTEFDRTGGSEDPYDIPESFRVAWINQNNQTFGTLSEPIDGSLTMTRSYYGFDEAHFDATNTKFFLIKTADIVDCTYQEFLDAYNAFINGGV